MVKPTGADRISSNPFKRSSSSDYPGSIEDPHGSPYSRDSPGRRRISSPLVKFIAPIIAWNCCGFNRPQIIRPNLNFEMLTNCNNHEERSYR